MHRPVVSCARHTTAQQPPGSVWFFRPPVPLRSGPFWKCFSGCASDWAASLASKSAGEGSAPALPNLPSSGRGTAQFRPSSSTWRAAPRPAPRCHCPPARPSSTRRGALAAGRSAWRPRLEETPPPAARRGGKEAGAALGWLRLSLSSPRLSPARPPARVPGPAAPRSTRQAPVPPPPPRASSKMTAGRRRRRRGGSSHQLVGRRRKDAAKPRTGEGRRRPPPRRGGGGGGGGLCAAPSFSPSKSCPRGRDGTGVLPGRDQDAAAAAAPGTGGRRKRASCCCLGKRGLRRAGGGSSHWGGGGGGGGLRSGQEEGDQ